MRKMRSTYNQYREKHHTHTPSPNPPSSIPTRDKDKDNDKKRNFDIHKWWFGDMQEKVIDELIRYLEASILVLPLAAANDAFSL